MAAKPKSRKPQTPATPTVNLNLLGQEWRSVAWAVKRDGHALCAESISEYIEGVKAAEFFEIEIPEGLISKLCNACLNHGVDVGAKIAQEADRHWQEQGLKSEKPSKPVPAEVMREAMSNAREELEGME